MAKFSDDEHTIELAEWVASGGPRRCEETRADTAVERRGDGQKETWRATG